MTKVIYIYNLEEYIRVIVKQEILGEYKGYKIKYQERKSLRKKKIRKK